MILFLMMATIKNNLTPRAEEMLKKMLQRPDYLWNLGELVGHYAYYPRKSERADAFRFNHDLEELREAGLNKTQKKAFQNWVKQLAVKGYIQEARFYGVPLYLARKVGESDADFIRRKNTLAEQTKPLIDEAIVSKYNPKFQTILVKDKELKALRVEKEKLKKTAQAAGDKYSQYKNSYESFKRRIIKKLGIEELEHTGIVLVDKIKQLEELKNQTANGKNTLLDKLTHKEVLAYSSLIDAQISKEEALLQTSQRELAKAKTQLDIEITSSGNLKRLQELEKLAQQTHEAWVKANEGYKLERAKKKGVLVAGMVGLVSNEPAMTL